MGSSSLPPKAELARCRKHFPAIAKAVASVLAGANRLPPGNLAAFFRISDATWAAARKEVPAIIAFLEAHQPQDGKDGAQHWRAEEPLPPLRTAPPARLPCSASGGIGVPVLPIGAPWWLTGGRR
jgi:hypothetical protein